MIKTLIKAPIFYKVNQTASYSSFLTCIQKSNKDIHLARKLWHAFTGLILIGLYISPINQPLLLSSLGSIFFIIFTVESLRLKNPGINATVIRYFGLFMRKHETRTMSTMPHYLLATLIVFSFFPRDIAILSMLFLACADPMASLIGIKYGHLGPLLTPHRTLMGTLAGITVCCLITFCYCSYLPFTTRCVTTLIGGLAGGLAELFPADIDDNLTIPILSGFSLWLTFIILGL